MEGLDLKQLTAMVGVIAEEKGLPEEAVLDVVQMAIAAAWRRENGDREMEVRALLDTHTGKAKVFVVKQVIEDGLAYNTTTEIPLESLIFLADYYDTSVDYLLGITNHNEPYPRKNVF